MHRRGVQVKGSFSQACLSLQSREVRVFHKIQQRRHVKDMCTLRAASLWTSYAMVCRYKVLKRALNLKGIDNPVCICSNTFSAHQGRVNCLLVVLYDSQGPTDSNWLQMNKPLSQMKALLKLSNSLLMLRPATSSRHLRDLQKRKSSHIMTQVSKQHVTAMQLHMHCDMQAVTADMTVNHQWLGMVAQQQYGDKCSAGCPSAIPSVAVQQESADTCICKCMQCALPDIGVYRVCTTPLVVLCSG